MVTPAQFVSLPAVADASDEKLGLYSSGPVRHLIQQIAPGGCNGSPAHHLDVPVLIE
jgi:hypothetical protein